MRLGIISIEPVAPIVEFVTIELIRVHHITGRKRQLFAQMSCYSGSDGSVYTEYQNFLFSLP